MATRLCFQFISNSPEVNIVALTLCVEDTAWLAKKNRQKDFKSVHVTTSFFPGGVVLEVCLAKYWANLGTVEASYSVTFHGIHTDKKELVLHGAHRSDHLSILFLLKENRNPPPPLIREGF